MYHSNCFLPTAKRGCVVSWASDSFMQSCYHPRKPNNWGKHFNQQVHHMEQNLFFFRRFHLPDNNAAIHITRSVQMGFEEHEDEVPHLRGLYQSADFSVIKPLWQVWKNESASNILSLYLAFPEISMKNGLNAIQDVYNSIPR